MHRRLMTSSVLIVLAVGSLLAGSVAAATLQVGPGETYTTIQAAIDAAVAGDTIEIATGTYTERPVVAKSLTITGAVGATVIIDAGPATGTYGFSITADDVTVANLTLVGDVAVTSLRYGFKVSDVANFTMTDVTARDFYRTGVDLLGVVGGTITDVTSVDNDGHGLSVLDCHDVTISGLEVSGNGWQGVSIATWGRYSPLGMSNVVFTGTNTLTDPFQIEMGDYNNPGVPPAGDAVITYSTNIADGADLTVQSGELAFAIHGEQDDAPDQVRIWLAPTLADAALLPAVGGPVGHFTGNDIFIEDLVSTDVLYITPGCDIQAAIDFADPDDTIQIAAGSYAQNFDVTKQLAIVGAGSGVNPLNNTVITQTPAGAGGDTRIGVVQLTGSGVSAAQPILLQDLRLEPDGMAGISVGRFTEATGQNVAFVELDNVHVIGHNVNPNTEQERGLYVDLTSSLTGLVITDCAFDNLTYGWYFQKQVSADASTVADVTVYGTTFTHNNLKGIYAEKLEDVLFDVCTVSQNGFSDAGVPSYFLPWMCGVDINLKAGTYTGFEFLECTITDNGLGGAKEGVGLTIKGRGTGGDSGYAAWPALVDDVRIDSCTITGNERGVRFGEPGKDNTTPTSVVMRGNTLLGNVQTYGGSDGTAYGDLVNMTTVTVDAALNWWGDNDPTDQIAAGAGLPLPVVAPWYGAAPGTTPMTWYVDPTGTIQDAIDQASAGDTIVVLAGTYGGSVSVGKALTLLGANAGIHPAVGTHPTETVGTRGPETILSNNYPALVPQADNITVDGFMFTGDGGRIIDTYADANFFHLTNCLFDNDAQGTTQGVIQFGGGSHTDMLIDFNLFQDEGDHTIYTGGGPFDRMTIAWNKFNVMGDGLFWTATELVDGVIQGNELDGTIGGVPGTGYGTINAGKLGNVQITDNWCHDLVYTPFQVGIIGGSITDNVIERIYPYPGYYGYCFQLWGGLWGTSISDDVTIEDNVFSFNDVPGTIEPVHGFDITPADSGPGVDGTTIVFRNNLFLDGGVNTGPLALRHRGDPAQFADAIGNWWGDASGPYHATLNPTGTGAPVGDYVTFSPWLTGVIFATPDPLDLTAADPSGSVTTSYMGGYGPVYGYSIDVQWDIGVATAGASDFTRPASGPFASTSTFITQDIAGGHVRIDAALNGLTAGIDSGDLFAATFMGVGAEGTQTPLTITVNYIQDFGQPPTPGVPADDGLIRVDTTPPEILDALVTDTTIGSTDWVKNGDTIVVTASITDGASLASVICDLTEFGGAAAVAPDGPPVGDVYTWTFAPVSGTADHEVYADIIAVDGLGNSMASGDFIMADNTLPGAVTGLVALPGHDQVHLSWDDPSGLDTNLAGVELRYTSRGEHPLYTNGPADPATDHLGGALALQATGSAIDWPQTTRDIYVVAAFAYDQAGNYGPADMADGNWDASTSYFLGDVITQAENPPVGNGYVDIYDITRLGNAYGLLMPNPAFDDCNVGPTDDWSRFGIPQPDGEVGFFDLMIFAMNFGEVTPATKAGAATGTPTLVWEQVDAETWELRLATECPGLKGLNVTADLPSGVTAQVSSGSLLADQDAPTFLRNIGRKGLDTGLAVMGFGCGIEGAGTLMRVTTSEPVEDLEISITARDLDNNELLAELQQPTGVELPAVHSLSQNYPNPFNPQTTIKYALPQDEDVRLAVYGIDGRLVRVLVNEAHEAGRHEVTWRGMDDAGRRVATGTYFCVIDAGDFHQVRKMSLVK